MITCHEHIATENKFKSLKNVSQKESTILRSRFLHSIKLKCIKTGKTEAVTIIILQTMTLEF